MRPTRLKTALAAALITCGLSAPAALACEAFWPDMERAALAVSSNLEEQQAIRQRHDYARFEYNELMLDLDAFGEWDGWEEDAEEIEQDVAAAAAAWAERVPDWDAADAELRTAIAAHEAACGPDRRTQELLIKHRLSQ